MIHRWLEEWHDTLVYLGVVVGLLGFFLGYWNGEFQKRYAELVIREFLSTVTVHGSITPEEYERLTRNLDNINSSYEVNIRCMEYTKKPVYALIPEEELVQYYMERNVKKEISFFSYEPFLEEEDADSLCLQKESNASILGNKQNGLPLPEDEIALQVESVKPVQKVYEGEPLLTICLVKSAVGEYYAEAECVTATSSGMVYLQLYLEDEVYYVPVQVQCYPRIVFCENGHEVVNSEAILSESKVIRKLDCPYCGIIPEYLICSTEVLWKKTGTALTGKDIWITVFYRNGSVELVTPESMEWQDSYDENYCGIQQVIVKYRGEEASFLVISENEECQNCKKECNERCYEDYVIFPYCTECMSKVALFTGRVYEEENEILFHELAASLDRNEEIVLKTGDFVRVYLSKGGRYVTFLQGAVMQDGRTVEKQ